VSQLSQVTSKLPKGTDIYAAFIAGMLSAITLAFFFWKSQQLPPPPPEE
jgi:hypothetical protein